MKVLNHPGFKLLTIVLLPLFFLLHEWNIRFAVMRFVDFFDLFWKHAFGSIVVYFIISRLIKDSLKAWWITIITIFVYLFFGTIQDAAGSIHANLSYAKYFFPIIFVVYVGLLLFIIKRKKLLQPPFLALLLVIYLAVEAFKLYSNYHFNKDHTISSSAKEPGNTPDVFLFIFDEYASSKALSRYWDYNNAAFDSFLLKNNFQLMENAKSNYNFTVFSVPSVLMMRYLPLKLTGNEDEKETYFSAARFAYNSSVPAFFEKEGYEIYNYSYFNLHRHPFITTQSSFHFGYRSVIEETFAGRFLKAIEAIQRKKPWQLATFNSTYEEAHDRINAVKKLTATPGNKPRFVYMHVLAPHPPFLTDSTGKMRPPEQAYTRNASGYTGYVAYWNGEIKKLVSDINSSTKGNAVIIIMGDHGYRDNAIVSPGNEHHFMNFLAVHTPERSKTVLPPVNSLVNLFPTVLNNSFGTTFPIRKDSNIFLKFKGDL